LSDFFCDGTTRSPYLYHFGLGLGLGLGLGEEEKWNLVKREVGDPSV
jgi:hypothetical protein